MQQSETQAIAAAGTAEPDLGFKARGFYYGGKWEAPSSGRTFVSMNPSTGRPLAEIPYADANDVDCAVKAAAKGFAEWRKVGIRERAKCLRSEERRVGKECRYR